MSHELVKDNGKDNNIDKCLYFSNDKITYLMLQYKNIMIILGYLH